MEKKSLLKLVAIRYRLHLRSMPGNSGYPSKEMTKMKLVIRLKEASGKLRRRKKKKRLNHIGQVGKVEVGGMYAVAILPQDVSQSKLFFGQ